MKKICVVLMLCTGLSLPASRVHAQIPILSVITSAIKKVIKAVDLEVQRLQNQTIVLQNAQKAVENVMSQLHLTDITNWVQKQKDLYSQYYNELMQVKSIIVYYDRVKDIAAKQVQLVNSYKNAWKLLQSDKHFTSDELNYIAQVYSGILDETVQNIGQLTMVVNSFITQMSDAKRMEVINHVAARVDENYSDLQRFNTENGMLSLQRAKDANDAQAVKTMYGL